MDIGKSFTFSFEDNDWFTKYLLGALISAIPILNFAWVGYLIDLIGNVAENEPFPLPDWSDLGDKFIKGLVIWLAGMLYALPAIILFGFPLVASIITSLSSGNDFSQALVSVFVGVGVVLVCLITLYFLAFSFFFPAVNIHYSRHGTFGSCFQLRDIFQIVSENLGNYVIAWLVTIVFSIVVGTVLSFIGLVTGFIICIGWILMWVLSAFATVWISTVYAHLFGQVAAEAQVAMVLSTDLDTPEEE